MSYRFDISHPKIDDSNKISVYKLSFDCGMFYIGSSINMHRRIRQYRYNFYNRNDINKKVKAALTSHNKATIEIIESCPDEKTVRAREDFHIKANLGNIFLLNRSKSAFSNQIFDYSEAERYAQGSGMRGKKLSPEQRKLWSDVKKGIPKSEEHKRKLSEAKKGKRFSDAHKKSLSESKKGKPIPEKLRAALIGKGAKKVDKFDLDGNFIQTYSSYSEAASDIGCQAGHIGEIVSGKYKHRNGFTFKRHVII